MPRTEEANQRIREERKEHILTISAQVFASKGLAATRIADIAAAGEISQGLIFRYFSSKEEIFAALVQRALAAVSEMVERLQQRPGSSLEKLELLLSHYLPGMWHKPDYSLIVQDALHSEATPTEIRSLVLEQSARFLHFLKRLIIEGQQTGEIVQADPGMLAFTLGACINGLSSDIRYAPALLGLEGPPTPELVLRLVKA